MMTPTSESLSKVLNAALERKRDAERAKGGFGRGFIHLLLSAALYADIILESAGLLACPFELPGKKHAWMIELVVGVLLFLDAIFVFGRYVFVIYLLEPIRITSRQKELLKIRDNDSSFIVDDLLQYKHTKPLKDKDFIEFSPSYFGPVGPSPFTADRTSPTKPAPSSPSSPYSPSTFSPLTRSPGFQSRPYVDQPSSPAMCFPGVPASPYSGGGGGGGVCTPSFSPNTSWQGGYGGVGGVPCGVPCGVSPSPYRPGSPGALYSPTSPYSPVSPPLHSPMSPSPTYSPQYSPTSPRQLPPGAAVISPTQQSPLYGQVQVSPTTSPRSPLSPLSPGASPVVHGSPYDPCMRLTGRANAMLASGISPKVVQTSEHERRVSPMPVSASSDLSGLRSRRVVRTSPYGSSEDCITDLATMETFLEEQKKKDEMISNIKDDTLQKVPYFSLNRSTAEYTAMLSRYEYQVSPLFYEMGKSQSTARGHAASAAGKSPQEKKVESLVKFDGLDNWVQGLRLWLGDTVISRVVREIDRVNDRLKMSGAKEVQIGISPWTTLRQASKVHAQVIPSFEVLMQFLDVGNDYVYVVQRIKELDAVSGLRSYKWDEGGNYQGKPWRAGLPTDAELVMHLLAHYLDTRLPAHPTSPEGKRFSKECLMNEPDKARLENKSTFCIYRSQKWPPHYQVIRNGSVYDLAKGRNNLFHAILLFFYFVKTQDNRVLREVSIGRSGINIEWVMNQ